MMGLLAKGVFFLLQEKQSSGNYIYNQPMCAHHYRRSAAGDPRDKVCETVDGVTSFKR